MKPISELRLADIISREVFVVAPDTPLGTHPEMLLQPALELEKQFSEDTLDALPGVFYMFDAAGRFVRWNHLFSKVTGNTPRLL